MRKARRRLAEQTIRLFAVFYAVVLPAFGIAAFLLVLPSMAVITGGCLLSALILGFFVALESDTGNIYPPRRRLLVTVATLFAIGSGASLAIGIINGNALPRQRLVVGDEIAIGREPFLVAEGRNETVWIGKQSGEVQSIDATLRQPIGTPVRAGHRLYDLAFFRGFVFAAVDHGKLVRLDPDPTARHTFVARRYGGGGGEIATGRGSVLVSDPAHARVYRFSPSLEPIKSIQVNARPEAEVTAIAVDEDGFMWVLDAGLNVLYKISLETDEVVMSKQIADRPETLLVVDGAVYIAHPSLRFIEKRDQSTGKLLHQRIPIATGPTLLRSASNLLLVCNAKTSSISPVSLETGKRAGPTLTVGGMPTDVDFGPNGDTKGWMVNRNDGNVMPLEVTPPSREKGDGD